ncbi:dTMP kinase [Candidatus Methanoliparum sp. LAM-1]|uniref:dTMP kinase n=1 Tax=Candidatus Methanoliparum sp. LAM-1 TaxID=2874846 RepID=UPI001E3A6F3E|nr:thymidylate kinase [Candidatus Methanoliparum sp. LAM-1]BDC35468.1 thymidylate kinase [Candidatus Methanoliparum sp. LAM-1]
MDGRLISIEGIDGSGKTSLVESIKNITNLRFVNRKSKICNKLNKNIVYTKEPTDYDTGITVKRFLNSDINPLSLTFLFMADHSEHISRLIRPSLEQGKIVIVDRYIDSRYAYQGVTLKKYFSITNQRFVSYESEIRNDPIKWLKKIHSPFSITPNYTILLVVDIDIAMERIRQREQRLISFEKREFLEEVQKNYLKLAEEEPGRFIKIDANENIEQVERKLVKELSRIFDSWIKNL